MPDDIDHLLDLFSSASLDPDGLCLVRQALLADHQDSWPCCRARGRAVRSPSDGHRARRGGPPER